MIRFIDLSEAYWTDPEFGTPLCAFLSTTDNRFLSNLDGQQTFHSIEEVKEHKLYDRLLSLIPPDFFNEK